MKTDSSWIQSAHGSVLHTASVSGGRAGGVPASAGRKEVPMEVVRSLWMRVSRPLAIMLAVFVVGGVAACQTTKGVGRDIENLGDNIEDAAEDAD